MWKSELYNVCNTIMYTTNLVGFEVLLVVNLNNVVFQVVMSNCMVQPI